MYIKTKAVLTAFIVVTLLICFIHAQDREPASGAKAPEKSIESASGAKTSEKEPEKSDAQKPISRASEPLDKTGKATMKRVTGIGGVFIKAKDPAKLRAWYKTHLGIDVQTWGGASFRWVDAAGVPANGKTAWYVGDGSNFAPSDASFMINYRVADLHGLLRLLREEGCQVLDKVEQSDFGIFGWVMDPEGNKVELWQPPEGQ
ncbi:MAG TPA: VOC family protein [Opitutaceae bacterium]|nr:VOC family protein [Opitutaceae bacterium]